MHGGSIISLDRVRELLERCLWLSRAEQALAYAVLPFLTDQELQLYAASLIREAKLRGEFNLEQYGS